MMRSARSAAVNDGLLVSGATRGSATISAAVFSACDHAAKAFASRAYSNAAFAYGRAIVARSATRDLGRQFIQQFGVRLGIDLAFQQARSALDRELAYFPGQSFARMRTLPRRFSVCLSHQALRFARGGALGFLEDFVRTLARHVDDLRGAVARFADDAVGIVVRLRQILLALFGSGESGCNLACALVHRPQYHRPHEFHREPDEDDEHDRS